MEFAFNVIWRYQHTVPEERSNRLHFAIKGES